MAVARQQTFPNFPLAELHAHLGASISPTVLWQLAHEAGIKLPKKEFSEFERYITLSQDRRLKLETYFKRIYHPLLDRLSSGAHEVEQATYHTMTGAHRANGITLLELRNNPMKHNQGGQFDLDPIIMAMLRGMERALLECRGLSAGLIFILAREFPVEWNAIIVKKAIKYRRRGVIGIDMGGPGTVGFTYKDYKKLFDKAHRAGLRITVHSGEVANADDMWEALEYAKPERIGHGIRAAYNPALMKELAKRGTVLEVCPMSNIATKAVANLDEMKFILRTFIDNKVRFCINSDWPEIIEGCHLKRQFTFLRDKGLLTEKELRTCNKTAFEASFIPKPGGLEAYL
jgi:adenosine deaminase